MALPNPRQKITGELFLSQKLLLELRSLVQNISGLKEILEEAKTKELSQLMATLFGSAILLEASDLHLEAKEEGARLRLRIDGVLQEVTLLENNVYEALLSRLKLLSGIKLNVADRPQDGRFTFQPEGQGPIEARVSSLPSEHGESLVVRILNPQNLKRVKDLGLRKDLLESFLAEIAKPNGMILVTGPTGSGKTTTLYAFLQEVQNPEIKIITIEDPIEYHLEGISQTQVQPGKDYTFASGLRAIVRQDPDVILVGEIRDKETAEIALQASLTGHLVFSTLHTNDAAGTVARLLSLGTQAANVAASLNLIIAQRLVRKVCKKCSTLSKATSKEVEVVQKGLKSMKKVLSPKIPSSFKVPEAKGCKECNSTGYRGRVGIFEAIVVTDDIEKLLGESPSIAQLREHLTKQGFVTMYQDGLLKVLEGITTLQELGRVTAE